MMTQGNAYYFKIVALKTLQPLAERAEVVCVQQRHKADTAQSISALLSNMDEEDLTFDADIASPMHLPTRKLNRLKRAGGRQQDQVASATSAGDNEKSSALADVTNLKPASSDTYELAPTPPGPSSEPSQSDLEDQPEVSPSQDPYAQPQAEQDYWDSEDELEAELTKRERAEGFHADSPSASGIHAQQVASMHTNGQGCRLRER